MATSLVPTPLVLFREESGAIPFLEWFGDLPLKAQQACRTKLQLLAARGHELDRPAAAYLGGGIYELRIKAERVHYRALYFFDSSGNGVGTNLLDELRDRFAGTPP